MRSLLFIMPVILLIGCVTPGKDSRKIPLKEGQLVTFEIVFPSEMQPPKETCIYLVTDDVGCSTRLERLKKRTEGNSTIYSGNLQTVAGKKRHLIIQCPKKNAQVFSLTCQTTPDDLEWIPCFRPSFIETSDQPVWNLKHDINPEQKSLYIPASAIRLQYRVTPARFP